MSVKPDDARSSWGHEEWWTWLDAQLNKGNLHALASADQAVAAFPQSPEFHSIRGKALTSLGRIDEAREALGRALELSPEDGVTHIRMAQACIWQGRFQEAARWLESASRFGSRRGERIRPRIASLRVAMGDYAGALRVLPIAIARAPNDGLIELHEQALRRLAEDAEAGVAPRFKPAYTLALEHLRTGQPAAAEAVLRKLVRYCPTYALGWMALKGAIEAQGRSAEARALAAEWARAAPRAGAQIAVGMGRKPARSGLVFDPVDPLPLAPMAEALTRVPGPAELKTTKDACWVIDPGGKAIRHDPVINDAGRGEEKVAVEYRTGPKFVAALDNAALVGRGVVVSADGRIVRELLPPCRDSKFGGRVRDGQVIFGPDRLSGGLCAITIHQEPAFLMTGPTDESFGDWIVNFAPRLALAEAAGLDCPVVIRRNPPSQALDILAALGVNRDRIVHHDADTVSLFPRLYVPSWPTHDKSAPSQGVFDIYRRAALRPATEKKPLLYLTRRNVHQRRMINEDEVCELFARRGFEIVDPGALDFETVRKLFADPACVAGPFGSAFHNLVFCSGKPTNLVILPSNTPFHLTEIALWQGDLGQRFAYVWGQSLPDDRVGLSKKHAPWIAPLDKVDRALDLVLENLEREPA
jgi:Flp pilus assembly protein TadD